MKKDNYIKYFIRYFPLLFFLLIAIFILIKFIFIVLFRAAFEPQFIFDFTPYYLLSGVNNLDLLLLSLLIIIFDAYLHFKISKKNLLLSFIPTGIMLAGLGIRIAGGAISEYYVLHYLIFGCLLVIAIIDQKQILMLSDMVARSGSEPVITNTVIEKPIDSGVETPDLPVSVIGRPLRIEGLDEILSIHKETLIEIRAMIKDDVRRAQTMMEELEKKSEKIDYLSKEIEERRKNLVEEEKLFRRRIVSSFNEKIQVKPTINNEGLILDDFKKEEKSKQLTMLDDFLGSAAIMQQGILKQVSQPFVELLGYETDSLLDKNLVDFIAPESLSDFEKSYSNKSNGKLIFSYKTVFLTRDNKKIHVEITIKPMIYDKKAVDLVLVRNLDNLK
jgi:PAS domain S-box-containing protein